MLDLITDDPNEEEIDDVDEVDEGGEIDDADVNDEFLEHENDETESDCMSDGDKLGWSKGDDCIAFSK